MFRFPFIGDVDSAYHTSVLFLIVAIVRYFELLKIGERTQADEEQLLCSSAIDAGAPTIEEIAAALARLVNDRLVGEIETRKRKHYQLTDLGRTALAGQMDRKRPVEQSQD